MRLVIDTTKRCQYQVDIDLRMCYGMLSICIIRISIYSRGYESDDKSIPPTQPIPVEWLSWIKGTRQYPPTDDEIALNRTRQQSQLATDLETEKRAPSVDVEGPGAGDRIKHFPKSYSDFERADNADDSKKKSTPS